VLKYLLSINRDRIFSKRNGLITGILNRTWVYSYNWNHNSDSFDGEYRFVCFKFVEFGHLI